MKISDAANLLEAIVLYNVGEAAKGHSANNYIVPFFVGDPGVGKTAVGRQVAKDLDMKYRQVIVAQFDPGELAGLPYVSPGGDKMIRLRPEYLPTEEDGGVIFNLDELPQAMMASQNVCSQIVNEWRVGEHSIPRTVTIMATGNKPENKAGTTTMPTHLRDRLMFIPLEVDHDDWLRYGAKYGLDPRVRAFIKQFPKHLHDFNPAANACPSPRSWEKASAVLSLKNITKHQRAVSLAGTVGDGVAKQFEAWLRVEERIPRIEEIIADPKNAVVFDNKDADVLYVILASLADHLNEKNAPAIAAYLERIPNKEFVAYWFGEVRSRDKSLFRLPAIANLTMKVGNKLVV